MTLKAVIVRAEGVLVDTEELQRQAFQSLITEAGYDWPCERGDFARLAHLPSREARLEHLIRGRLQSVRATEDMEPLVAAMQRRLQSLMEDVLASGTISLRPAVRDLVVGCRADGVRVALVSTSRPGELDHILSGASLSGAAGLSRESFDHIICEPHAADAAQAAFETALSRLGLPAENCLVIEGSRSGLAAGKAAGLRVLVTRDAYCAAEGLEDAIYVVDSLLGLLPAMASRGADRLSADVRSDLVAAMHRLHAGIIDLDGAIDRSNDMKVSEILKAKGTLVKSISASETIWALAHRLRTDAIGALVVMRSDGSIEGIISERDVARGLAEHGSTLPSKTVSELMTRTVITCSPGDSVAGISRVMTQRRIRHLPVVEGGKVVGLISIGDVLSFRLDQMQREVNVLRDYAIAKS